MTSGGDVLSQPMLEVSRWSRWSPSRKNPPLVALGVSDFPFVKSPRLHVNVQNRSEVKRHDLVVR
jgi:hypothetical protein